MDQIGEMLKSAGWKGWVALILAFYFMFFMYVARFSGMRIVKVSEVDEITESFFEKVFPNSPIAQDKYTDGLWAFFEIGVGLFLLCVGMMDWALMTPIMAFPFIVVLILVVIQVIYALIRKIIELILGLFIKHPIEQESKKWKKRKKRGGLPPIVDYEKVADVMFEKKVRIKPKFVSNLKKNQVRAARELKEEEIKTMDTIIEHTKKRLKFEDE